MEANVLAVETVFTQILFSLFKCLVMLSKWYFFNVIPLIFSSN